MNSVSVPAMPFSRQVVPSAEVLDMHPRRPAGGINALLSGGLQLAGNHCEFLPGLRRGAVEAGLFERILVDVEHRSRTVEGQRQHVAFAVGVIARDRGKIVLRVERLARLLHQLVDRLDRALRTHHGRGPDLEHLQNVRRVAGAERGDRRGHRFGVLSLEDRDDLVFLLAGVEAVGELVDLVVERPLHRMPPLDFGLGSRSSGEQDGARQDANANLGAHAASPTLRHCSAVESGAPGANRTRDLWLRRPSLYPLSYGRGRGNYTLRDRADCVP